MAEEVMKDLYRIEIPLPGSPLKSLNSYVVKSPERNLIIDTGLGRKECLEAMQSGLSELDIDLNNTDLFITHLHADHFSLVSDLATDTSKVYFNRPDAEIIESWSGWDAMISYAGRNGFPDDLLKVALDHHPGHKFKSKWIPELSILKEGDRVNVGDYHFKCVETPGHTRGHICLYEPDKKVFIAGDHILIDITPNIQCWSDQEDPLKDYLNSLDKVYEMDIDIVLPGHRRLIKNHKDRIRELKDHHEDRANEVLAILGNGSKKTSYEVASEMKWDIKCESWDEFPVAQKWFATGEAISHLRYLEEKGLISRNPEEEIVKYGLNNS